MHSRVPRIDLRYVAGISPDVEATRAHTLHWLAFQGLIVQPEALRTYDASRFDRLSARMCPNSRGAGLDLVSDWMGWLFVFDDQFDGPIGLDLEATRAVLDELLAVIQGSTPQRYPSSRLGAALLELWGRSTAGASASWKARFRLAPEKGGAASPMATRRPWSGAARSRCNGLLEGAAGLDVSAQRSVERGVEDEAPGHEVDDGHREVCARQASASGLMSDG